MLFLLPAGWSCGELVLTQPENKKSFATAQVFGFQMIVNRKTEDRLLLRQLYSTISTLHLEYRSQTNQ